MTENQTDTSASTTHRRLRFESIDDVLAEVERIEKAHENNLLRANGNWTAGQVMSHVAAWIEYGYDGYPLKPAPFFIRWVLKLQLRKYLRVGMPTGARIPGVEGGTCGADELPVGEAAERLKKAFLKLKTGEPARFASPGFGKMDETKRVSLNLRHAELHLGFLDYELSNPDGLEEQLDSPRN